jgi:hypothetical protein
MKNKDTTHASFDLPDDLVGQVHRYISGLKGVLNVNFQPNGRARMKGEAPSRMTESSRKEVVAALFKGTEKVTRPAIKEALKNAGFTYTTVNDVLNKLIKEKAIKRVGYGTYIRRIK